MSDDYEEIKLSIPLYKGWENTASDFSRNIENAIQQYKDVLITANELAVENERLNKFCKEFVYGEENPQYYKTMDEKVLEIKEYLLHSLRLLSQYNEGLKREHALASKIGTTADDFIKAMKDKGFDET